MFFLNPNSGVPLYVQLEAQIRQRILAGQFAQGERLPSVRELSRDLQINPLTVVKVYQLLEQGGFVRTKQGSGTFVSRQPSGLRMEARRAQVGPAIEQLVAEALHLGLSEKEIATLLSEKFRQFKPKS